MHIKNVKVYGEDKRFEEGEIFIDEDRGIFAEGENLPEGKVIDGEGCFAVPGSLFCCTLIL